MSKQQLKISEPSELEDELTERKLSSPFISEKKIKGHNLEVYDITTVTFPDGVDRIITCSFDRTLRIFNIEKQKCEKIITHSTDIYSVHFYKEEQLLMITDRNGELVLFSLFPEIKIIKKLKVSEPESFLFKITQISSNEFFCCVERGPSQGCLYHIKFRKNNDSKYWISEEIDYPTLNNNNKKEYINCIHQLISQKSIILFASGNLKKDGGEDFTIKTIDINNNNNFKRFPKKHSKYIHCLTSFINTQNNEIILSGGYDDRILFWSLKGEYLKELEFSGTVNCFLQDFSRNNIFVIGGWFDDMNLLTFSTKTEKLESGVTKIHGDGVESISWVDEDFQNSFISCSQDKTFNIYELETILQNENENEEISINEEDINKTINCLKKISDLRGDIKFKFKNNNQLRFWKSFIFENGKTMQKSIGQIEISKINQEHEETLFSIIMGSERIIPNFQLAEYYNFFKVLNLKHCIAAIIKRIEKMEKFEEIYFSFRAFCLKYENDIIKSWFSANSKKVEKFQPTTFATSFALSLFNRMKKVGIEEEGMVKLIMQDIYFGTTWAHLKKYKESEMINIIDHRDFNGVKDERELSIVHFLRKMWKTRFSNFNLTLISTDKKEFKVHKEILILRSNFFFSLFNFGGLEVTEYEETGKISLKNNMSSDVVEILIKYAYLGRLKVDSKGISTINTFCKLLIFCDQFNEKQLMERVTKEFKKFVNNFKPSEEGADRKKELDEILKIVNGFSSLIDENEMILGIIIPLISDLGEKIGGIKEFFGVLIFQNLKAKEEKRKLRERNLELERMVAEMKDEKGVGKGQLRDREEDEEDEEIKKEQPKRKKRKYNKK